jgi:hypothetical protein
MHHKLMAVLLGYLRCCAYWMLLAAAISGIVSLAVSLYR